MATLVEFKEYYDKTPMTMKQVCYTVKATKTMMDDIKAWESKGSCFKVKLTKIGLVVK